MRESERPRRPGPCPLCGARARVVSNPFFGVGLAVHSHLLSCTRCQFIGFLPVRLADRASGQAEESAAVPREQNRGGLARMIRFGRR